MIRLDFAPVERWFALRYPSETCGRTVPSSRRLAEYFGVTDSAVRSWRQDGIPLTAADDIAVAADYHASFWWPYIDEIEPFWVTPPWLRRARTLAVLESWRLRADCTGVAGVHARRMFNMPEPQETAA